MFGTFLIGIFYCLFESAVLSVGPKLRCWQEVLYKTIGLGQHCRPAVCSWSLLCASANYSTFVSPSAFSRRAVVSYWRKYVHKVLVNRLGGLSLPRKSVVSLTDRPNMTLDVYRGHKTTMQHQQTIDPQQSDQAPRL